MNICCRTSELCVHDEEKIKKKNKTKNDAMLEHLRSCMYTFSKQFKIFLGSFIVKKVKKKEENKCVVYVACHSHKIELNRHKSSGCMILFFLLRIFYYLFNQQSLAHPLKLKAK